MNDLRRRDSLSEWSNVNDQSADFINNKFWHLKHASHGLIAQIEFIYQRMENENDTVSLELEINDHC